MKVLILHNRYRVSGGEERAVELHAAALQGAGVEHRLLDRDSAVAGRGRAAAAMLRGGDDPRAVGRAATELGAGIVHCHNMQPLFGPRALEAARSSGARVVLHLHNFRLFCAIGVSFRDGEPCFRCHHGTTLPGLALNCRGSLPEAAVYAAGLARQLPRVLAAVDRFVAPSGYAVGQLTALGVPADRIRALPHYLPDAELVDASQADTGGYALAVGRLAAEKGFETAVEAAAIAGVPLKVAGEGPLRPALRRLVSARRAPVELLGRVDGRELRRLRRGAALFVAPTRGSESFGLSALEAMGAGVPVVAARAGALPELVGEQRCVPRDDPQALAAAMRALWDDPHRRRADGDALIARAGERFSQERFTTELLALYAGLG
ncbi:MAG: glycosyltransferase family 4 protein [Thermoleophilaceae bacterium]